MSKDLTVRGLFRRLKWIDGRALLSVIEPYRLRIFEQFFEERDGTGNLRYNLGLFGRGKKNAKTMDLVLGGLWCLVCEPPTGYDADCSLLANDKDQAGDDLQLAKKIVRANAVLLDQLVIRRDVIERRDGRGFMEILPAGDVVGSHGKTRRFVGFDEIHGFKDWSALEGMQPDPNRLNAQTWITSYASLFHRPGAPLFDLTKAGRAGTDPRMLFSWYAADHCTDPEFSDRTPEERANPSMVSWGNPDYLAQQQRRLPAHVYRRLHLNLPGLPEGSAYQPEPVMDAIERGTKLRTPEAGMQYRAFVDMSGGSVDDAVLGIGHVAADGRAVVDAVIDQGHGKPFDPNKAVGRFVRMLRLYGCARVVGDRYAGETFRQQFEAAQIKYVVSELSKSELYESFEPTLNGHRVVLPDLPVLEQQLLGLSWRGGKIDHQSGEHDDYANAAVGVTHTLLSVSTERKIGSAVWGRERRTDPQPARPDAGPLPPELWTSAGISVGRGDIPTHARGDEYARQIIAGEVPYEEAAAEVRRRREMHQLIARQQQR